MGIAMKTVAIVGAGPSGLVAAKNLLRATRCKFDVTIFEKKAKLGGIWAVERRDGDALQIVNADMPTNASRYTVSFSDFAWSSVDLVDEGGKVPQPRAADGSPFVPMFPRAWQVQQYLRQYAKRYIPEGAIHYQCTITGSERVRNDAGDYVWKIRWHDHAQSADKQDVFDYLLVASGYNSEPDTTLQKELVVSDYQHIKYLHSSKLRRLEDIAPDDPAAKGTILVVGGSMSGAEAASALAYEFSNAQHAPNVKVQSSIKVVQVVTRPVYALPPIVPYAKSDTPAPRFFTLDMGFYDLTKRPPGPVNPGEGRQPLQISNMSHKALQTLVGGDQSELDSPSIVAQDTNRPAFAAIQESYAEYLRSGAITTIPGHLKSLFPGEAAAGREDSPRASLSAKVMEEGKETVINDIIGVVFATGFKTTTSLDFLPEDVKAVLEYDAECNRIPIILADQSTMHPAIDNLGFVGHYEVPFWAAMEKQAEFITDKWAMRSASDRPSDQVLKQELEAFQKGRADVMRQVRQAIRDKAKDVPQYWMGDYVGTIEMLSRETGTQRNEMGLEPRTGPVFGARYVTQTGDAEEAAKLVHDLLQARSDALDRGRFVARATFRAMQGKWKIERKLDSFLEGYPSGELTGTASFHPRKPTDEAYDGEYLYIESGSLKTRTGLTLQASRRYVYRYQELSDRITVWFVKEDGRTVDYLYNELVFDPASEVEWLAKSHHLCIKDMYRSEYTFRFQGMHLRRFAIKHSVKGPSKDYISDTCFER